MNMKLSRRKFVHLLAGSAAADSVGGRVGWAQDAYPSRPIHVIVGFTPGAAADVAARVLS
jgi:tripartite-type tricarboxylate transporter receptor subunit TctC